MANLFPLTLDASGAIVGPENVESNGKRVLVAGDPATFNDEQLQAVFQVIDDTPGLNFYMLTDEPRKLKGLYPRIIDYDGTPEVYTRHRPNVIIGVRCATQAEADRLIPGLLKLGHLCHALWVDLRGQTEEIDFSLIPIGKDTTADVLRGVYTLTCDEGVDHPGAQQEFDGGPLVHFVTIGGIDQPVHPQWLRLLRDQCKAAGVKCWFDGWGEWARADQVKEDFYWIIDKNSWWDFMAEGTLAGRHYKYGSTRSGHLLDGVEVREALEGSR